MANPDHTIITEPVNSFLLKTFQAFLAETQDPGLATTMTCAHVSHLHALETQRIATSLARIDGHLGRLADLTDPVRLGQLQAMLDAQKTKRAAAAENRRAAEHEAEIEKFFGPGSYTETD